MNSALHTYRSQHALSIMSCYQLAYRKGKDSHVKNATKAQIGSLWYKADDFGSTHFLCPNWKGLQKALVGFTNLSIHFGPSWRV